jgi:hypothetical protein
MSNTVIVEMEGFEGELGTIDVYNARAASGMGRDDRLYCVASFDAHGVARLVDWGYATVEEARKAWPDAATAPPKIE